MVVGPRLSERVQRVLQRCLSLIPLLLASESVLRPGRQLQLVGETEQAVDVFQEVETAFDFLPDLVRGAEEGGRDINKVVGNSLVGKLPSL